MAKYSTTIKLNKSKKKARFGKRSRRNYSSRSWSKNGSKRKKKGFRRLGEATIFRMKLKKIALVLLGTITAVGMIGTLWAFSYVQRISAELPSPDDPFGVRDTASAIYDRNGTELYKVFGDENRDLLSIEEIPDEVQWVFIAAEDADFFEHPGFDAAGIVRCGINNYVLKKDGICGGSTITQQMVKITVLTNERKIERKVKELLLSLQVERKYSKEEILEIYLNIIPFGSNIYGLKTASKFYFDKEPADLTLEEASLLAGIPQNPVYNSPTISPDPTVGAKKAKERQLYVLGQIEEKLDKVNSYFEDEDLYTLDQINEAKEVELIYQEPRIDIKAPHFVFYVQELLQSRDYNDGIPFTLSEIETGGYQITTTLDYDLQQIAENAVAEAVNTYGARYGASNAALLTMKPGSGDILTMVGSKNYWGKVEPAGCVPGDTCRFEGNVNNTTSLHSPGSTAKAIAYYTAFEKGIAAPGSIVPDIPIEIGSYRPRNYDGRFYGINTARTYLAQSRNIPAIIMTESAGVQTYIDAAVAMGYTTFNNPFGYGPSIAIGGSDVKLVEHAQGFAVFANGGDLVQHEVILKITDRFGDTVYEHEPEKVQVADSRAIYLVNDILNPKSRSGKLAPAVSFDGRDVAGKTGTSEDHKDTWYAYWSPDFVTVGWLGNNNMMVELYRLLPGLLYHHSFHPHHYKKAQQAHPA